MNQQALILLLMVFQNAGESTAPGADFSDEFGQVLKDLQEKVAPSVVAIEVARSKDPEGGSATGPVGSGRDYYARPSGPTSGTIFEADGWILTSAFNVSGEVTSITVTLHDGTRHPARLMGADKGLDIALLKIEATGLPVLPRADLSQIRQGDFVCVIGRSPNPGRPTLNLGVLSAKRRFKVTAVQTDAELSYGNVGGPLVSIRGALIGITSHVIPGAPWGQASGVGFATHLDAIAKVYGDLKRPKVETILRVWIGCELEPAPEGMTGVKVARVAPDSPAEDAGIHAGDIVTSLAGQEVRTTEEAIALLKERNPGERVSVRIKRPLSGGTEWADREFEIELAPRRP